MSRIHAIQNPWTKTNVLTLYVWCFGFTMILMLWLHLLGVKYRIHNNIACACLFYVLAICLAPMYYVDNELFLTSFTMCWTHQRLKLNFGCAVWNALHVVVRWSWNFTMARWRLSHNIGNMVITEYQSFSWITPWPRGRAQCFCEPIRTYMRKNVFVTRWPCAHK